MEAPPAGADQVATAAHVEAVAVAYESATTSATANVVSEAAVLNQNRAFHGVYTTLFLLSMGAAARHVRKYRSGESGAHEDGQFA